ncbi:uncharacterized protein LOC134834305 [Culicoides brevitarsis]|uniref:uncharacterized protein LOC134834305 n=1 Tax=Culicoides brevitarsis TaxID=469753 RepID=UPI00307B94FF
MSMSKAASTPIKCENLMDLNDDCLLYLLRFFDLLELMNLRGVCRRLDNLILQSRSRFATLDFETVPRKYGAKLLEIFKFLGPEMKSLALDTGRDNLCSNLRDKSVVLDWINEHCVNLESYDHHSIDLSDLRTFQKFRPIVKRLKALSLNYVEFDDRLGECFKDAKLEALEIVYNENITEKFFKNVSTLKSLDLGGCSKLTSDSYIQILKKNLTLKKLSININSLIGSNSKTIGRK